MRIIDFVNGKFPGMAEIKPPVQASQAATAFDLLLAEAGRRHTFDRPVVNRDDTRGRPNENRREQPPVRRRENQPPADEPTSMAATAAIQDPTQYAPAEEPAAYHEAYVNEEKIVAKVAEILQIPEEIVVKLLQELEMEAVELTDPQAVAKLLKHKLGAETTAELITTPEFPELYKALNEAVAEVVVEAKAETAVATQNVEAALQVNKETVAVNAEALQGLEATIEDGEIVIANETASKENFANNAKQQSATTQTATEQPAQPVAEISDAALFTADEAVIHESQSANPTFNVEAAAAKIEAAVKATPQQPVNATNVIEQIMNQVKLTSAGGNFTEIRMTLRPESLGDIVLRVLTQNGIVTAQFEAESQRVKEALEASFNQLRDALTEQGIKFSELSVFVRQDENERASQFERARQNSRNRAENIEDISDTAQEISYHNGMIDLTA